MAVFGSDIPDIITGSSSKSNLIKYLEKLKELESKLWGIAVNEVAIGEENILEASNHLIHLINNSKDKNIKSILAMKEVREFFEEIVKLRKDFIFLRRKIKDTNKLRNYITRYTIKLVDQRRYDKMRNIFILEKQLYDVLDIQEAEFRKLIREVRELEFDSNEQKVEEFLKHLYKVRDILAGHMDHHQLWEEERTGYSNTSNILNSLLKEVKDTF